MIGGLKPYSGYKDSDVPWLGQVPNHWQQERAKWRFRCIEEINRNHVHTNILSLTLRGVVNNNPDDPEGLVPKDYGTYQFFARGDLVFKLIDLENLRTSRVGLVHEDGIMSAAYVRLIPSSGVNIRYFFHQFYDLYSRRIFNQLGGGVRSTLVSKDLLNIQIVVPPRAEQDAITRTVDWVGRRLERTIKAKRKVIALLNEQKQAIIHGAVTRGLNAGVQLKPSGVPWIGDVPSHWSLVPNRTFLRIRKVLVGHRHGEYKLLSLTKSGVIVRDMSMGGKFSNFWERSQEVQPGNLVFCFFDVEETPRTVGLSRYLGMISGDYTVMECLDEELATFVECFYKAMDDRKLLSPLYSGLRKRIPKPEFLSVLTPVPPRDEMRAIIRSVEDSLRSEERRVGKEC